MGIKFFFFGGGGGEDFFLELTDMLVRWVSSSQNAAASQTRDGTYQISISYPPSQKSDLKKSI